jgi:hypothetical protein
MSGMESEEKKGAGALGVSDLIRKSNLVFEGEVLLRAENKEIGRISVKFRLREEIDVDGWKVRSLIR